MPLNHKAVIDAIIQCRTQACGITVYECEECGEVHHPPVFAARAAGRVHEGPAQRVSEYERRREA